MLTLCRLGEKLKYSYIHITNKNATQSSYTSRLLLPAMYYPVQVRLVRYPTVTTILHLLLIPNIVKHTKLHSFLLVMLERAHLFV